MNVLRLSNIACHKLVALSICGLLTACGGGGGGAGGSNSSIISDSTSVSISATANTTAQSLTVGTAMGSFSPLTPGGGAGPYVYSYAGTLPAGLSLDPRTGVVTGTPTATYASASVVFSVQDAKGVAANTTSAVTFTVGAASSTISATANTAAQSLMVNTAMTSFSPLTPSGGATPYVYSYTGTLPAGLSLNPSTGAVTGTPTATSAVANVVFSVKDANNGVASTTSTVSFSVLAAPVSISATASTTTTQSLTVGTAMASFTPLTASGGATPYVYSITSGALPAGLSLSATIGAVTGTPTTPSAAANVVFSVRDANNGVASTTNTVRFSVVAATPSISATASTTAQSLTVGTAMSNFAPLTAINGTTPYTYSITSGALPAGLSLNTSTGTVSGTPTATYPTANVVFSVKDAKNVVANTTSGVSFTVGAASPSISATATTTARNLTVGTAMASFSPLAASGGTAPYTYSISSGTLPAGLSLNASSGAVTGTPTATYSAANVVFSVKDANNAVASTTSGVSFTVVAAPVAISATANTTAQSLTLGTAMASFTPLTASGGATPYVYSITSGALPAGLSLNTSTGTVTGTPTATYTAANVLFSVKDANNGMASTTSSVSFTVTGSVAPSAGWANVKMGGGGYVPGIIYHPTVANLRYARTDVAGAYRWDNASSKWTALTDAFGRPDGDQEGAESMAVDPTDANKVYMTTSLYVSNGNGRFYYSSNQGNTWNYANLPFQVGANNQGRAIGERLMVDPNLPSTLFYASRTAGLWKSTNSGLNWSQVSSLSPYVMSATDLSGMAATDPNGQSHGQNLYANGGVPIGVEFVVFDTTVPTTGFVPTGSATPTIYVGVAPDYKALAGLSSNLYKSINGGATWSPVAIPAYVTTAAAPWPGINASKLYIPHLARAADGMLYVPFTSSSGPGSAEPSVLYKFDGGTTWTKLVASTDGSYWGGIGGISVYGSGATTKIVFGVSNTWGGGSWTVQIAMRSTDGGLTWAEIGQSGDAGLSRNYHDATGTYAAVNPFYWGWVDDLDIDPFNPNHVSYVTGGGVWSTNEAFSTPTPHWTFDVTGIEEMADLAMMAPPPGASYVLASGQGDTGIFVHTSLTAAPTLSPNLGAIHPLGTGGNGTGIDMAWNNPAFIAAVGTFGTSRGAYSTDSGATWTEFPAVPPSASAAGDASKVVVTADGSNVIWSVAGQIPYYTTDKGTTWTATNLPAPVVGYHIAADRKNPLKVYAYEHGGNFWYPSNTGRFYHSTDGGHTFTARAQTWAPNGFGVTDLAVNPFAEGDVWVADANNLWHSVNSGLTWTKLTAMATVGAEYTNVHGAIKVALGVPAAGSSYSAAVYLVGTVNGKDGVYRSDDQGITWTRIDDDNHRYGGVGGIVADTKVYGRVFLAGRGMNYNY